MYDDDGKLVYLYRVIDGLCTRSQAFSAALTVGLPDSVCRRAHEVCLNFNLSRVKIISYLVT